MLHTTEHLLCARYCVHFRGISSSNPCNHSLRYIYYSFIHFTKEVMEAWRVSWWAALLGENLECSTPKIIVDINV